MKVVLLQDVKSQGKKNEIIEVSDSYARNFLIKKNLAQQVTPQVLNELNQKKQAHEIKVKKEIEQARNLAKELEKEEFVIIAKIGDNGKLFGSITVKEIEQAIIKKGFNVEKKQINLKESIKTVGQFIVELKLYQGVNCKIKIIVK